MISLPPEAIAELADLQAKAEAGIAMVPSPKFVGEFVLFQRCLMGWKQETLAQFAGVSLPTIQRVERGEKVSGEVLDRLAAVLGQKEGAFTKPRIPLTGAQLNDAIEKASRPWDGKVTVRVRPVENVTQVASLVHSEFCIIDGREAELTHPMCFSDLRETMDCVAVSLLADQPNSMVERSERPRLKRRELYYAVLQLIKSIRIKTDTIALCGVYDAKTNTPSLETVRAGTLAFFSRRSDPGAIKRRVLFAPEQIDTKAMFKSFMSKPEHVYRMHYG